MHPSRLSRSELIASVNMLVQLHAPTELVNEAIRGEVEKVE